MTTEELEAAARGWIAAWNSHDLEAILAHYADEIVFQTPTAVARWGRADGVLRGKDELRRHFARGLELVPALHFELEQIFTGPAGYAVLYRRENGNRVIDTVELDGAGRAVRGRALYAGKQA